MKIHLKCSNSQDRHQIFSKQTEMYRDCHLAFHAYPRPCDKRIQMFAGQILVLNHGEKENKLIFTLFSVHFGCYSLVYSILQSVESYHEKIFKNRNFTEQKKSFSIRKPY
jgi:hypothetical protein